MTRSIFACLALAILIACYVAAKPPRGEAHASQGDQHLLDIFDGNGEGELSRSEIQQSSIVLDHLDKNGDGVLKRNEMLRPRHLLKENFGDPDRPRRESHQSNSESNLLENAVRGTVLLQGGYLTDPRDGGRPVALIAAALNVPSDVFRKAFSGVTPARGGGPSPSQARANKRILLDVLSKHGVTNDRLDEVSDFYRYQPQTGELWRHRSASAVAVIEDDKVIGFNVLDAGVGYLSPPQVQVAGFPNLKIEAKIELTGDLKTNGRLVSLKLLD